MASERGLGKGLGALLGDAALQSQEGGSVSLPLAQVEPGLKQPRNDLMKRLWPIWPTLFVHTVSSSPLLCGGCPPAIIRSSQASAVGGPPNWPVCQRCPLSS